MAEVVAGSLPVLLAMGALLLASAWFSSAETAVFSLGWGGLQSMGGGRLVRRLEALLADRRRLLVTILLGNLVVNVLYFNLGTLLAVRLAQGGHTTGAVVLSLLILVMIVLFGEVLPKSVAVAWPSRVARLAAEPLWWLQRVLLVPRVALGLIADAVGRVLTWDREEEGELDPDELGALLSLAAKEGHLARGELDALQAVLALSRTTVKEIMVPRVDLVTFALEPDSEPEPLRSQFLVLVAEHRHNKIPVHAGSVDQITGFLDAKEVLMQPEVSLAQLLRPVDFIPETVLVTNAMERFREARLRVMIVVDEYGGTEGLLTHEDLTEAVVGDLMDESDAPEVVAEGPGRWIVDAGLGVRRMARIMGLAETDLPVATIGGLVTLKLGRMPRAGDHVWSGRVELEVVTMDRHHPGKVRVRVRRTTVARGSPAP
ncbi:MAG: hypothetical protein CMJ83_22705 [Planctomycetes bacterium]|nr:hypothetical protein [Planctomycetota bacterium]